ncbi:ComF family protein [Oxalobacteraceae bacterium]|nr:ComF family protein [Oxalobacteraceae bacterium]
MLPVLTPLRHPRWRLANWRAALSAGALLRGLLPACCALCGGASDDALCAFCRSRYCGGPPAYCPRCPRCANPLAASAHATAAALTPASAPLRYPASALPDSAAGGLRAVSRKTGRIAPQSPLCGHCLSTPSAFDATVSAQEYAAPLDQLVLQLKFGARLALAPLMAGMLAEAVLRAATPADASEGHGGFELPALLCPVPLGPRRLAERGFNQALEIARPLARVLRLPLYPRLACRLRDTAAQSSVAPEQRRQNIAKAFVLPDPALVRGRHVGIVDDVMTSGQTLDELAATLKRHGAVRVSNLVFARTPPH